MTSFLTEFSGTIQFSVLFVSLQIILLVGLAWLIAGRFQNRAALRHFIWLSVLLACGLLVPLHQVVPAWNFQVAARPIQVESTSLETIPNIAPSVHKIPSDVPAAKESEFIPPCLLYTSPSPRDGLLSRMPSSA